MFCYWKRQFLSANADNNAWCEHPGFETRNRNKHSSINCSNSTWWVDVFSIFYVDSFGFFSIHLQRKQYQSWCTFRWRKSHSDERKCYPILRIWLHSTCKGEISSNIISLKQFFSALLHFSIRGILKCRCIIYFTFPMHKSLKVMGIWLAWGMGGV